MSRGAFLYGLWCLAVMALFMTASFFGYSPFADGGRAPAGHGAYGPTHK